MRLSTGLFAVGGFLYLAGLYGFTTFLPEYRASLASEIAALHKEQRFISIEERYAEEWLITSRHAQWEAILYPGFMAFMGVGMIATGAGAIIYLRERRRRIQAESQEES